jgi:hypothetical protein
MPEHLENTLPNLVEGLVVALQDSPDVGAHTDAEEHALQVLRRVATGGEEGGETEGLGIGLLVSSIEIVNDDPDVPVFALGTLQ